MSALIIGSSGLVGGALLGLLRAGGIDTLGTYWQHSAPGLAHLDVTDEASVRALLSARRPDVVFLMAALTAVDYCETHEEEARRINVGGARAVAQGAADVGAKLVFYSTEYVFDGTAGPYSEEDPVCPQSVYARTKADAEQLIRDTVRDHLVLRTTVVFGWDPGSMNFAMQVYRRLSNGEEMRVPGDQVGNPTLVDYLAETSWRLIEMGARGTVNVVGLDRVARSEFGQRLAEALGLDPGLIKPVRTEELGQLAPRPLDAGLKTDRLTGLVGAQPLSLDEAIRRFVGAARGRRT